MSSEELNQCNAARDAVTVLRNLYSMFTINSVVLPRKK